MERYSYGMDWRDTVIFKNKYSKMSELPKGAKSISDLEVKYREYDSIYESIKNNGFDVTKFDRSDFRPMYICLGSRGELYYTKDGNHRLFMAIQLGFEKIPVKILVIHKDWIIRNERSTKNYNNSENIVNETK